MRKTGITVTLTERERTLLSEAVIRWIMAANDALTVFGADEPAFDAAVRFRNELRDLNDKLCANCKGESRMSKIVVVVMEGMVADVYCTDKDAEIEICDVDSDDEVEYEAAYQGIDAAQEAVKRGEMFLIEI